MLRSGFLSSFVEFCPAVSEEKSKMSQPIRGQGGHFVFPIGPKHTNLVENVEILLHVKFRWILFSDFRGEVENVSANHRLGRPSCFSDRPKKHKLGRERWDLASCQFSAEFHSAVLEEKSKMSQPIRGQGSHLVFPIGLKNTNLVEDVEILLPVKFRWILFSGFRGEVENVSANQRPGRPSCFSDRLEKHKLGRGHWDLASCHVSLNSVQRFQRRSQKCEKLTTTDDRRRATHDHNSALEPSAQVHKKTTPIYITKEELIAGVEINTGPVARGQWFFCRASKICYQLTRLACKILKPNFWVDMAYC